MKKLLVAASIMFVSYGVQAATIVPNADIEAGKKIAENVCAACHGLNGVSIVPTQPNLGGQNLRYLYEQMLNFKQGYRVNGIMQAQVAPLSQQDMANVSAYYASQEPWGAFAGNPETAVQASKLYLGGNGDEGVIPCAGCHGPKAGGNAYAAFPRLGGQHKEYLSLQLKMFRAAGRADDVTDDQKRMSGKDMEGANGMMQVVASRLSDNDIKILSDYLSAVH